MAGRSSQPLFDLGVGQILRADRRLSLLLAAVLLVAFLVRLNGYDFGLPYQLQPDEPNLFIRALQLSRTGQSDWAVRTPPGYVEVLRFLIAAGQIVFGPDVSQAQLFALGRLISVVAGALCVGVVFLIGALLVDARVGLVAAAFAAVNPAAAEYSRYMTADSLTTLLALLSLYVCLLSFRRTEERYGWLALVLALLAFLTKYSAIPVVALAFVALARHGWGQPVRLLRQAGVGLLLVVTVGAVLMSGSDFGEFLSVEWSHLTGIGQAAQSTAPVGGPEGASLLQRLVTNFQAMVSALWWLNALVVLAGVVIAVRETDWEGWPGSRKEWLLIVALAVAYWVMVTFLETGRIRHMLVAVLALPVFWGMALDHAARWLSSRYDSAQKGQGYLLPVFAVALLVLPAAETIRDGFLAAREDTRAITADWLLENAPDGSVIAVEYDAVELLPEYGGFPGPKRFQPAVVPSLLAVPLDEYRRTGVRYLVADERAEGKGGYFSDPNNAQFVAGVRVVKDIPNDGRPGPRRIIFELAD